MKTKRFGFLLLAVCFVWGGRAVVAEDGDGGRELFNGRDLSGWHGVGGPATNWDVVDGELICTNEPGSRWLRTEREYADFDLKLEFKIPEDGNSGVFVRAPLEGAAHIEGFEIQILDDYGPRWRQLAPNQFTGAIYAAQAPSERVTKPAGEWQTMRIRLDGRQAAVWVNGQQVIDANLDELARKHPGIPGLKRERGYIGLQHHSSVVYFRNLRIRELDSPGQPRG